MTDSVGIATWCATLIATTPGVGLVAWFCEFDQALTYIAQLPADACLVSAVPPSIALLRRCAPGLRFIVITDHPLDLPIGEPWGLLAPGCSRAQLLAAIDGRGGDAVPSDRTRSSSELSRREREVALLLADGFSNREIASMLSISPHTVKNHVHHILDKLHATRRGDVGRRMLARTPA